MTRLKNGFSRQGLAHLLRDSLEDLSLRKRSLLRGRFQEPPSDSLPDIEAKELILFELLEHFISDASTPVEADFTLFLSWSHDYNGLDSDIYDIIHEIAKVERIAIVTGQMGGKDTSIISDIRSKIECCDMLLCVMTPESRLQDKSLSQETSAGKEPSPWLISEIAMAMAFSKPFTLIVHEDISSDYWKTVTGAFYHHICSNKNKFDDNIRSLAQKSVSHLYAAAVRERRRKMGGTERW